MSYLVHNFKGGDTLKASQLNEMDAQILENTNKQFELEPATDSTLGGIKVGDGLSIDNNGILSVNSNGASSSNGVVIIKPTDEGCTDEQITNIVKELLKGTTVYINLYTTDSSCCNEYCKVIDFYIGNFNTTDLSSIYEINLKYYRSNYSTPQIFILTYSTPQDFTSILS